MAVFLQIPSDQALTEPQALAIAKNRWHIFLDGRWTGDGECDGVEWQGSHGVREQRTWAQLNQRKTNHPNRSKLSRVLAALENPTIRD